MTSFNISLEREKELKKDWEKLLRSSFLLRKQSILGRDYVRGFTRQSIFGDNVGRIWLPALSETEKDRIRNFVANVSKDWKENLQDWDRMIAELEDGRVVSPWTPPEGGLPLYHKGELIDENKEEFRGQNEDGTDYELLDDEDVCEKIALNEDGTEKIVFADRVEPVAYNLKSNEIFTSESYIEDGEWVRLVRAKIGVIVNVYSYDSSRSFVVDSWELYKVYRTSIDPTDPHIYFKPAPHKVSGQEIWTYDQYKQFVINTYPKDYLEVNRVGEKTYKTRVETAGYKVDPNNIDAEETIIYTLPNGDVVVRYLETLDDSPTTTSLTFLASFVDQFLREEPLGSPKKHLVRLMKILEYDLRKHQPIFWEKIAKYVKLPQPGIPIPYLHPDIQSMVKELDDHITFMYSAYPDPTNWARYRATVLGILREYEFLLRELYFKFLRSPNLFRLSGKLVTQITDNINYGENTNKRIQNDKNRQYKVLDEHESSEAPQASPIAETIHVYGAQRAQQFKSQAQNITTELKNRTKIDGLDTLGKQGGKTYSRNIQKDIDPMGADRLGWMSQVIKYFLIYKDIHKELDQFFGYTYDFDDLEDEDGE